MRNDMRNDRFVPRWLRPAIAVAALLPVTAAAQTESPILARLRLLASFAGFRTRNLPAGASGLQRVAEIVGLLLNVLLAFLGVMFLILIIVAGLRWMTARGDEQQVEQSKTTIKNALLGLLVVVGAYAIVNIARYLLVETQLLPS